MKLSKNTSITHLKDTQKPTSKKSADTTVTSRLLTRTSEESRKRLEEADEINERTHPYSLRLNELTEEWELRLDSVEDEPLPEIILQALHDWVENDNLAWRTYSEALEANDRLFKDRTGNAPWRYARCRD